MDSVSYLNILTFMHIMREFRITFAYIIFYEDELLMFQCDQKPQQ